MTKNDAGVVIQNAQFSRVGSEKDFALHIPNFTLSAGALVALVGPSGCGKSTLLSLLSMERRFNRAEQHQVTLGDSQVNMQSESCDSKLIPALRRRWLGYMPEGGGLLPFLSVRENCDLRARVAGLGTEVVTKRILEHARELQIEALLERFPRQLSGGERQRASLLQTIVHRPAMILADEPTAALHPGAADVAMALFARLTQDIGSILVISTHDQQLASRHGFQVARASASIVNERYTTTFEHA